jgi:hypothetical protein
MLSRSRYHYSRPADVGDTGKSLSAEYTIEDGERYSVRDKEEAGKHDAIITAEVGRGS